jgi:hypothetical protein
MVDLGLHGAHAFDVGRDLELELVDPVCASLERVRELGHIGECLFQRGGRQGGTAARRSRGHRTSATRVCGGGRSA